MWSGAREARKAQPSLKFCRVLEHRSLHSSLSCQVVVRWATAEVFEDEDIVEGVYMTLPRRELLVGVYPEPKAEEEAANQLSQSLEGLAIG